MIAVGWIAVFNVGYEKCVSTIWDLTKRNCLTYHSYEGLTSSFKVDYMTAADVS